MCFNTGKADRNIRIMLGLGLLSFGLFSDNYIMSVIGFIPLVTGVIGFCPLYPIFKLDTGCKKD